MKFLTMTNAGCVDICENMLHSGKTVGLNLNDFFIACLDETAFHKMKKYSGAFLYNDISLKEYQNHSFESTSGFREIVKNKWKIIKNIYLDNKELCWIDSDIVFKENPLSIIKNSSTMLFQSDHPGMTICSGFMVFNNTDICSMLIDECSSYENEDDQIILNKKLIKEKKYWGTFKILDSELFPNGHAYFMQNKKDKAILVHNNCIVGIEEKINRFKTKNLWALNI